MDGDQLDQLGQRAFAGMGGRQAASETERPVRLRAVMRHGRGDRNPQVVCEIEYPSVPLGRELRGHVLTTMRWQRVPCECWPLDAVVPPDGRCIAFHQLEQALENRLFQ